MAVESKEQNAARSSEPLTLGTRLVAPDILIHLHIPKTGGMSLSSMIKHAFRNDEIFDSTARGDEIYTGLGVATDECCHKRLSGLSPNARCRLRYVAGHVPMGIHRELDRPAKYFTVIRNPIDRVVSYFFFLIQMDQPLLKEGRPITFEEFVESDDDIHLHDYQTRIVSGCRELDAPPPERPGLVPGTHVERRHLNDAKRNIERHFLAVAPLEHITELALLMRIIYGWPMRRLQTEYKNRTKQRPHLREIAPRLIKIIEKKNSYDMELYELARKQFAELRKQFEPELTRDRRIFGLVNHALNVAGELLPRGLRKRLAELFFYA